MKATWRLACAAALMTAFVLSGGQIQARADVQEKVTPPPIPLKVTVEISRFDGARKTAGLPFVLWVNTGSGGQGQIQMGSDVPVPQTSVTKEGTVSPVQSYTYRSLGTNITCEASAIGDGLYRLTLNVNDSQVFRAPAGLTQAGAVASPGPIYQNFRSTNSPILRDGQSVQFAVATDKTSGEIIKLDVTLNLVK